MNSINWSLIGRLCRRYHKQSYSQFKQSSRCMHGWRPTMHMRQHITGVSQCLGCSSTQKTMHHMLLCPHALMKKKREEILSGLRNKGLKARLPRAVADALHAVIRNFFHSSTSDINSSRQQPLQDAMTAQRRVGIHMMIRGFIAAQWETAMDELGVPQPQPDP